MSADRKTGTVKWFNDAKGLGYIAQDDGPDLFVHSSSINVEPFKTLEEGQRVEYEIVQGPRNLQAIDVTPIVEMSVTAGEDELTREEIGSFEGLLAHNPSSVELPPSKFRKLLSAAKQIVLVDKKSAEDCPACGELEGICLYHEGANEGFNHAIRVLEEYDG